jgi:rRNA maturation endonuclease Nob1
MARCPECGSWIWHPPKWFEEHVCPNCGAILKLKGSLGGFFLGSLEVVGHTAHESEESSPRPIESLPRNLQSDLGEDRVQEDEEMPSSGEDLESSGRCEYCHAVISPPNARFCANCGASLSYGSRGATPRETEEARPEEHLGAVSEHEDNCIVCSLRLTRDDDVVWCPHCGGLAHRNHMLDWVRQKRCCPACDKPLSEEYYE